VGFLAILRREGYGLWHDERGTREERRDRFWSEPPPLPARAEHDWMQRLVAVTLQREKSAIGACVTSSSVKAGCWAPAACAIHRAAQTAALQIRNFPKPKSIMCLPVRLF
jgi:hypothetical protein